MSPTEISGYIQIVLGLIGIVLTITNVRKLVPDIDLFVNQNGLPPELESSSGFIRIAFLFLLITTTVFLICAGFSITLSTVYKALEASHPILSSSMTIGSIVSMSVTAAMALYKIRFWVAGFVGTTGCAASAVAAAVAADIGTFWVVVGITLALVAITGIGTLMSYLK